MMISPQHFIGAVKFIQHHPRFRVGVLSLASFGVVRYVLWKAYRYWCQQRKNSNRGKLADGRKQQVKAQCSDGDPEQILALTIDELTSDLKKGKLTAEEVLKAFQKKALDLDERVNGITEPIMEALDQAKGIDKKQQKEGLLFGLPVSLKENVGLAGYDSTGGMGYFVDKILQEDAIVVKVLRHHGAIPFIRTNIPQTMMSFTSSNPIYGETSNPHDLTRSPGGSSSGEGAMIGGGGSWMGIGTDVGGSTRIPSAYCGCYGLKTTNRRVSYEGVINIALGNLAVRSNVCPIAKNMKTLILLSKALMSQEMYDFDRSLPPLPFNEEAVNKKSSMRIGYYVYDGNLKCQPAIVRGVMEAKAALENRGHTLVPIEIPDMSPPGFNWGQRFGRVIGADRGDQYFNKLLVNDKLEKAMKLVYHLTFLPPKLTRALSFVVSFIDKFGSDVLSATIGFKSIPEYFAHIGDVQIWRSKFMESWQEKNLDAIICPVYPSIAPKKEVQTYTTVAGVYCMMYNILDYPSGVLPVTKVTADDVRKTLDPKHYRPTLQVERMLMKGVEDSEGMPVGVQCVALPFQEEMCLRVMNEVEAGLNRVD